jgi:hypothetical protein
VYVYVYVYVYSGIFLGAPGRDLIFEI